MHGKLLKKILVGIALLGMPLAACSSKGSGTTQTVYYGGGGGGGTQTQTGSYTALSAIQAVCQITGTEYQSDGQGGYYTVTYWDASQTNTSTVKSSVTSQLIPTGFSMAQNWTSGSFSDGTNYEATFYSCGDVYLAYCVYSTTYQGQNIIVLEVESYTNSSGGGGGGGQTTSYTTLSAIQAVCNILNTEYESDGQGGYYTVTYWQASQMSVSSLKSSVTSQLIPSGFSMAQTWTSGSFSDGTSYEVIFYTCGDIILAYCVYSMTYQGSNIVVLEVDSYTDNSGGGGGGGQTTSYTALSAIQAVCNILGTDYQSDGSGGYYTEAYWSSSQMSVSSLKSAITSQLIPSGFTLAQTWTAGTFSDGTNYDAIYYTSGNIVLAYVVYTYDSYVVLDVYSFVDN